ncbi:hypothetical protein L484_017916 [Morus notabilis]|uniref:Uncharacterized protein n=1 Tax=Morus notabilis TaxID=981085 RepID=W9RJR0_9ROSA|nr:hypothetical protein L484_017916 [Morus notabilis]
MGGESKHTPYIIKARSTPEECFNLGANVVGRSIALVAEGKDGSGGAYEVEGMQAKRYGIYSEICYL